MTDAAFDSAKGAGLRAVLVAPSGTVICWLGIHLTLTAIGPLMIEGISKQ